MTTWPAFSVHYLVGIACAYGAHQMKSFVIGIILGSAVSCAAAFASSTANHNGAFWNQLNRGAKEGYVNGYADAMRMSSSNLDMLTTAGELFDWKGSHKIIHQVQAQLSMSELAPADVVNRLDTLYQNQKYGELDVGSALGLFAVRPQGNSANGSSSK
jgi:hypothetical protein